MHKVSQRIKYRLLSLGLTLDIAATAFMIYGSSNSAFTLHGFVGYSALLAMLIDTVLIWK